MNVNININMSLILVEMVISIERILFFNYVYNEHYLDLCCCSHLLLLCLNHFKQSLCALDNF